MRLSSRSADVAGLVGRLVAEHAVQDVDAAAGQCQDGLVLGLALGSLASVGGLAGRVAAGCDERGLVEEALEGPVAGGGALQVADLAWPGTGARQGARASETIGCSAM
jgi:hypothetical protein